MTIQYAPFRNGEHGGALVRVTFADGRTVGGRTTRPNIERQEGIRTWLAVAVVLCAILSSATGIRGQAALPDWSGAWIYPFEAFGQENTRSRIPGDPIAPKLVDTGSGPRRRLNSENCPPTGMPNVMRARHGDRADSPPRQGPSPDRLTVEDPVALLEPWKMTGVYTRTAPVFFERICQDNNREGWSDIPDLTPPSLDLPHPP